jgi:hypothetical protein
MGRSAAQLSIATGPARNSMGRRQFPQVSTAQNANPVTNNLDRGFGKAKTGSMSDGSPNRTKSHPIHHRESDNEFLVSQHLGPQLVVAQYFA